MRQARTAIILLLLSMVTIDGIAVWFAWRREPPDWLQWVSPALFLSQTSLLALWMGIGRTPGPLRALATTAWISFRSVLETASPHSANAVSAILFPLLAQGSTIALVVTVARWRGLHGMYLPDPNAWNEPPRAASQFTLGRLFAWTTVLAMTLGAYKWAGLLDLKMFRLEDFLTFAEFVLPGRVLVALVALWALLKQGPPLRRLPILAIAEVTAAGWWIFLAEQVPVELSVVTGFSLLEVALLSGFLLVIRRVGYRVTWPKS